MAAIVRYVNTASTAGGDGTTNATSGANRAYATLAAWNTAQATNLVSAGDTHTVYCSGGQDTGGIVQLTGWTTGASNRLTIACNSGQEHGGKWNTGVYYLSPSDTFNGAIEISPGALYTTVQGMQLENRGALGSQPFGIYITGADNINSAIRIVGNIIRLSGAGTAGTGDQCIRTDNDLSVTIVNNLLIGAGGSSVGIYTYVLADVDWVVYNNTIANCGTGIDAGVGAPATMRVFNNICTNCTTDFATTSGWTSGGNCSEDATSPQAGLRNRTFTFVNAGAGDYHLASNDAGAMDQGTDMSADGTYAFSTDIDGQTRTGTWDSGADQYVAAGGSVGPPTLQAQIIRSVGI